MSDAGSTGGLTKEQIAAAKRRAYQREYYAKNREKVLSAAKRKYAASVASQEAAKNRVKIRRHKISTGEASVQHTTAELIVVRPDGSEVLTEMYSYGALGRFIHPSFQLHRIRHWARRGFLPPARHRVTTAQYAAYTRDEAEMIRDAAHASMRAHELAGIAGAWVPNGDFRAQIDRLFAEHLDSAGIRLK